MFDKSLKSGDEGKVKSLSKIRLTKKNNKIIWILKVDKLFIENIY